MRDERPLATFALIAYNQERFIREAVEGALSQTYEPLEIILSDDCSTDHTYDIMQETAASYDGPHRLVLNRNEQNLGNCEHVNTAFNLSRGELFIFAAGDDVSYPDRAAALVEAWLGHGGKCDSIVSLYDTIDENGEPRDSLIGQPSIFRVGTFPNKRDRLLHFLRCLAPAAFGCANACSRRVFEVFGSLPKSVVHEDLVLSFRAHIMGGISTVNRPLLSYRVHSRNLNSRASLMLRCDPKSVIESESFRCWWFEKMMLLYDSFIDDVSTASRYEIIPHKWKNELEQTARKRREMNEAAFQASSGNWYERLKSVRRLAYLGAGARLCLSSAFRLLPRSIFLKMKRLVYKMRSYSAFSSKM